VVPRPRWTTLRIRGGTSFAEVDLKAVQYAGAIHYRAVLIRNEAKAIERRAEAATPRGGGHTDLLAHRWPAARHAVLGCTVDMEAILDRLEAHFSLGYRLLPDTDPEGFRRDLDRELEQQRKERVERVLERYVPDQL